MERSKWNLEPNEAEARIQSSWRGTWMVLRCASNNTTALVAALTEKGIRAWTPLWVRSRRYPRSCLKRKVLLPCLPSFVFIAEPDVIDAVRTLNGNGVPGFSVMHSYGVFVRIRDEHLDSLRKIADLNPRLVAPVIWPEIGDEQKIISGAFQGMIGVVKGRTDRHCLVDVGSTQFPIVKIPPFLLSDIEA